ncbi:5-formyltetrahydrofolate cyclo-ligase [Salinibacter altiplanensis]|uniref:5-formyltetrahydrofolate cyclo-ligase n=1 Tax=Salinibacter altiplanensis TaxID=1803181 RepID=UPI000C9EF1DD|nr:5-formyltetrahydrofolate cyclo-ligase [Salinibacter altiplanensis]
MAPSTKDTWRRRFRTRRRALSPQSYRARSSLIGHRALTRPAVVQAQVVHVYWPLTAQREVDTRPLIALLRARDVQVVLPVVTSFEAESPTLEHRRYTGPASLTPNRWGIQEPTQTERVPPDAIDAVVVPALGVGRDGHRVGHGSGYYDAFLQSVSCPRVALTYEACLVASLPNDSHDVPVTAVVTEQQAFAP